MKFSLFFRIQMGDEMSKRRKFLFLTWIGPEVGVIQRAKMSTDKAIIKDVINVRLIMSVLLDETNESYYLFILEFCGGTSSRVTS